MPAAYYVHTKMARRVNSNVSTSAVSRAEKVVISELLVIGDADTLKKSGSRINSSFVWRYFGALHQKRSSAASFAGSGSDLIDDSRMYCRLVLWFEIFCFR